MIAPANEQYLLEGAQEIWVTSEEYGSLAVSRYRTVGHRAVIEGLICMIILGNLLFLLNPYIPLETVLLAKGGAIYICVYLSCTGSLCACIGAYRADRRIKKRLNAIRLKLKEQVEDNPGALQLIADKAPELATTIRGLIADKSG